MVINVSLNRLLRDKDFPFHIAIGEHLSDVIRHSHNYVELVIILDGSAIHLVDEEEYDIKAGDIFVIKGHMSHGFKDVASLKLCNIMFDFGRLTIQDHGLYKLPGFQSLFVLEPGCRKEQGYKSKLMLDYEHLEFVKSVIYLMQEEYYNRQEGYESITLAYLLSLISYLSRQYTWTENPASHKLHQLSKAVAFMESNFSKPVTIQDLAALSYISTRHFIRVFKANYRMTPTEFIIHLRLDYACKLLKNTDLPVAQISESCGFSDISFFSRQFKHKIGVTPSDFRHSKL